MASQTARTSQTSSDIPAWLKSLATLDLERLANEFLSRVRREVTSALVFWNSALRFVPKELHSALDRLVDVRLDWLTRSILNSCPEGRILLLTWSVEKVRGPSMPKAPFFTPSLAYDYYAGILTQYGSSSAREMLRVGNLVLLALRKQSSTLANKGLGSYDDQIVVLNGLGRARVGCAEERSASLA